MYNVKKNILVIYKKSKQIRIVIDNYYYSLEFKANEIFPAQTASYCLILHNWVLEYKPINGGVEKVI